MARVIWSPEALASLDRIVDHIREDDTRAAARYLDRLIGAGFSLADFPLRGRPTDDGCREFVRVRPYIITYETDGDAVHILRIRHMAQDR